MERYTETSDMTALTDHPTGCARPSDASKTVAAHRCVLVAAVVLLALTACAREPEPSPVAAPPPPKVEVALRPVDSGDFRGFRWGEPADAVAAAEGRRSEVVSARYQYRTTIGGHPAIVSLGRDEKDRLTGGINEFPWPGESESCRGTMSAGSECSLQSAQYALAVCEEVGDLLAAKYHEVGNADSGSVESPPSAADLDGQLLRADDHRDRAYRQWASERVLIFQVLARGREAGKGWRCQFQFIPPFGAAGDALVAPQD